MLKMLRFLHNTIFQYYELLLPQSGCEIETIKQLKVKVKVKVITITK